MSSQQPAADPLFSSFQLALAGHYSIDRELGRGGMGVVYLAREVDLDRLVAIKLLPPEKANQPLLRDRFLREARLTSAIARAKQSLGRYPSEKALAELATDMPRTTARETTFDGLAMVASSAASVAGAVLRNERMATCTLVVGPWRR